MFPRVLWPSGLAIPIVSLALLAAGAAGGCGTSPVWAPPPASSIPVPPAPAPAEPNNQPEQQAGAAEPLPAAPTPAAISADLPGDLDGRLAASATCSEKECIVPGLYPPSPAIDGRAPAAAWSHDLAAEGSELSFPKHSGVDLYGVVLKGSVKVRGVEPKAKVMEAKPWVAFRAPGAGVSVAAGEAGTRVVLAAVSGGEPIAEVVVQLRGKDPKRLAWKTRPSPVETINLAAATDLAWGGGAMHARIGFEGAAQRASLGILLASKDAPVPQHKHDTSWEILIALRAGGTLKRAERADATDIAQVSVEDGSVAAIAKGALHTWEPAGVKPLVALQMYVPPGPEQRFKALAAPPVSAPAP